jgi:hypothetical protein
MMVDTLPCDPATTTDAACRNLTLGLVNEAEVLTADGETDNVSFFNVVVEETARKTFIPMMFKTVVTSSGTVEVPAPSVEPRMWPQTIK